MKRTRTKAFLLSTASLIFCMHLSAQGVRSYAASADVLTIDNASVSIDNVFILDSLKGIHVASFEIPITSSDDTKKILASILSALQGNKLPKLTLRKLNYQFQVVEEKNYNSVTVSDILLSDMAASSARDNTKMRVRIQAQDVSDKADNSQNISSMNNNAKRNFGNGYAMTLGNLPTPRISGITNLRITNQLFNGYLSFNIETPIADSKQWKEWFNNGMTGKREAGNISFRDQSLSTEILNLQMADVEIISISEFSNAQGTSKAVISLRTKKYDLK